MKKFCLLLAIIMVLMMIMSGCGGTTSEGIKIPSSAGVYKGQNYQKVLSGLEEAGFTNVETETINDLTTGLLTKDGEVEQVSVDGEIKYNPDARYHKDVKIIVTYHTFKEDSVEDDKTSEPVDESGKENITISNNEELASIFKVKNEYDSSIAEFVKNHKGELVEFDACILLVNNHEDYDTRYDILLSAGDYVNEDTVNPGPLFKIEDVSTTNMGIKDLYLPDFVSSGSNIHVVAKIFDYNNDKGLFMLKPVSVEER